MTNTPYPVNIRAPRYPRFPLAVIASTTAIGLLRGRSLGYILSHSVLNVSTLHVIKKFHSRVFANLLRRSVHRLFRSDIGDLGSDIHSKTDGKKKLARSIAAKPLPAPPQFDKDSNPHSEGAQARRIASAVVHDFCVALQQKLELKELPRYDEAISPREKKNGGRGRRTLYATSDMLIDPVEDPVLPDDVISFVDVADHMSVTEVEQYAGHILAMYHTNPSAVSWCNKGGYGHLNEDGTITEAFAAGEVYHHAVWNCGALRVTLTFRFCTYIYELITIPIMPQREVIFFIPVAKAPIPLWASVIALSLIGCPSILPPRLSRVSPPLKVSVCTPSGAQFTFLVLKTMSSVTGPVVTIRQIGIDGLPPVTISLDVYNALVLRASDCKEGTLNLFDVGSILKEYDLSLSPENTLTLAIVMSGGKTVLPTSVNFTIDRDLCGVSAEPPSAYVVGQPLAAQLPAPVKAEGMAALAVALQQEAQQFKEPPEWAIDAISVFVGTFRVKTGLLHKFSIEMVAARMAKPSQKIKVARVRNAVPTAHVALVKISVFVKGEARAKARGIYPTKPDHSVAASMYSMALYDATKKFPWFCSGKSGVQIATAVHQFFRAHMDEIPEGYDVEACDGSIPELARILMITLVCFLFDDGEAGSTLMAEAFAVLYADDEVFINFMSNLSGSPWTTLVNSIFLAFLKWWSYYGTENYTANDAWDLIGPTAGDDGGIVGSQKKLFQDAATEVGIKLKWEGKPPGMPNAFCFLNRLFPDPRVSISSAPAMKRLLTTVNTAVGVQGGLALRIAGWRASDPEQVDIHCVLDAFERCTPGLIVPSFGEIKDHDTLMKINIGAWPLKKADIEGTRNYLAFNLEMDKAAFKRWLDRISKSKTIAQLKALYLYHITPKKIPKGTSFTAEKPRALAEKTAAALAPGKKKSEKARARAAEKGKGKVLE